MRANILMILYIIGLFGFQNSRARNDNLLIPLHFVIDSELRHFLNSSTLNSIMRDTRVLFRHEDLGRQIDLTYSHKFQNVQPIISNDLADTLTSFAGNTQYHKTNVVNILLIWNARSLCKTTSSGYAYICDLCRNPFSVICYNEFKTVTTITHELGHILGMNHSNTPSIMSGSTNSYPNWANSNVHEMEDCLKKMNCLENYFVQKIDNINIPFITREDVCKSINSSYNTELPQYKEYQQCDNIKCYRQEVSIRNEDNGNYKITQTFTTTLNHFYPTGTECPSIQNCARSGCLYGRCACLDNIKWLKQNSTLTAVHQKPLIGEMQRSRRQNNQNSKSQSNALENSVLVHQAYDELKITSIPGNDENILLSSVPQDSQINLYYYSLNNVLAANRFCYKSNVSNNRCNRITLNFEDTSIQNQQICRFYSSRKISIFVKLSTEIRGVIALVSTNKTYVGSVRINEMLEERNKEIKFILDKVHSYSPGILLNYGFIDVYRITYNGRKPIAFILLTTIPKGSSLNITHYGSNVIQNTLNRICLKQSAHNFECVNNNNQKSNINNNIYYTIDDRNSTFMWVDKIDISNYQRGLPQIINRTAANALVQMDLFLH
ncbi:hypothetical protein GJ496_001683 [Pomphorhynchus laevis]|nr:hypothetical protein GJ496_001683 [Pomphorhynchus laevis]